MAADLNLDWVCSLPRTWSYGVTKHGRVFFINEEAKSTTWLHPVTGEAVVTGHRASTDLPTGWEEGYTFEGARYYINHNERKVTCKHPVTGQPSQDNCIFVVSEQTASTMASQEKKERPPSMVSEAANYNRTSDSAAPPLSPIDVRSSRPSKKVHNFGKRSNSIKRNPNAPVIRRSWLYKQDGSGMKLWKKRWFVLSDLCLFYYRDEKEEGILGSILLPSFKISLLSTEDHINRKYAFKATHPNMRTYYFCTDTVKEMELWMKAMTDAALVQTEPVKRVDRIKSENSPPQERNNILNHKLLIKPEVQNNHKNKEVTKIEEKKALEAEKYGFQKDGQDRPLTKINSVRVQSLPSDYENSMQAGLYRIQQANGPEPTVPDGRFVDFGSGDNQRGIPSHGEPVRIIQRTNSMQQLEQWIQTQKDKGQEESSRGVTSYQTLPRNMPSHRAQVMPRYPEGYRTLPRNLKNRPESICSMTGSAYDRTMGPMTGAGDEKRRSIRDDTMWQLYEWQQRQFYQKQTTLKRHSSLNSPKTMINISDQAFQSIPTSPSHGSIAAYQTFSPHRPYRSDVTSALQRADVTLDRRHRTHLAKHVFVPDRRSMPAGLPLQPITPQSLQGKTPEELTLLLIKLRRQQAELSSVREHTLAQLMQLKHEPCSPKNEIHSHRLQRTLIYVDHQLSKDDGRGTLYKYRTEEADIDTKLSRLCEQDKVVQALEAKLQLLHKEKYTLEQALLSASQEMEMNADNPTAIQNAVLQRDGFQNGLLSTCREVSRATADLERAWREYDRLEFDVTAARNQMRDQLERLGEVQTESAGIQGAQMQKELWRIQDVMEGLSKHKQQRNSAETGDTGMTPSSETCKNEEAEVVPPRPPLPRSYDLTEQPPTVPPVHNDSSTSSLLCYSRGPVQLPEEKKIHQVQGFPRNGSYCGPDYRLYKSEPELTTVAEVDESNGDDKTETLTEVDSSGTKGPHFPVGIIPPRTKSPTPESLTIASYVTLRKNKLDLRTERPRSAVDQLCLESPRPRMTVEEQMERIKRHQQACLKEKKKGLNFIGDSDQSPSVSPSSPRENPFKLAQFRRRDDKVFNNITELEDAVRENDIEHRHETPAQEILRLKEAVQTEKINLELPNTQELPASKANHIASDTKEDPKTDDVANQQNGSERMNAPITNSLQNVSPLPNHILKTSPEGDEAVKSTVHEGTIFSYEITTDTAPKNKILTVESLSSSPESPKTPPAPSPKPQLTEGSHFMCV
ncbi:pleckstrin homology domain-containing family A member 5 isoform X4 [Ambystoma mexicanum]|uniref:pleckstrin homology domain-containing family A member 5 isoform X4 n=1 Tax=Ambystoma mexicanum TaxID=8296 RepID=UPI0037E7B027